MTDDMKEKLSNSELSQITEKKIHKLIRKMFQKNVQYTSDILELPIDEEGNTTCTQAEGAHFFLLMYGILDMEENEIKEIKNQTLANLKKLNSKLAEELIDFKSSSEK